MGQIRRELHPPGRRLRDQFFIPEAVAENVLCLSALGKTRNPYFHPRIVFRFAWCYVIAKGTGLFGRRRRPRALPRPSHTD